MAKNRMSVKDYSFLEETFHQNFLQWTSNTVLKAMIYFYGQSPNIFAQSLKKYLAPKKFHKTRFSISSSTHLEGC